MTVDVATDPRARSRSARSTQTLFVAWQHPQTRAITPVGRLLVEPGEDAYFSFAT